MTQIPPHRVSAEAVYLTWKGEDIVIPSDHPNYDAARHAVYGMRWDEVFKLRGRLDKEHHTQAALSPNPSR